MGVVSGGGGSGAPFNGGTITNPLLAQIPAGGGIGVEIDAAVVGQADDLFYVQGTDGAFFVLKDGGLQGNVGAAQVNDGLFFDVANTTSVNVLTVAQHSSPFATLLRIGPGGYLLIKTHSAPADADVATGEAALWFDQTNGAAKLMVKAKQADGTVRTGSVNLA